MLLKIHDQHLINIDHVISVSGSSEQITIFLSPIRPSTQQAHTIHLLMSIDDFYALYNKEVALVHAMEQAAQ